MLPPMKTYKHCTHQAVGKSVFSLFAALADFLIQQIFVTSFFLA
jgi:hypothetical protein